MARRPKLAVKIAHCIAQWSENEVLLGGLLAFLLHANQKAAVAMYSGLDNRSAQLRLITAAAAATLPTDHAGVVNALLSNVVRPAIDERARQARTLELGLCRRPTRCVFSGQSPSHDLFTSAAMVAKSSAFRSIISLSTVILIVFVFRTYVTF